MLSTINKATVKVSGLKSITLDQQVIIAHVMQVTSLESTLHDVIDANSSISCSVKEHRY
jgi:hypothetical protein